LIDRIRQDIHERLDQLVAEADKLRRALAALDPREKPAPKSTPKRPTKRAQRSASTTASTRAPRSVRDQVPFRELGPDWQRKRYSVEHRTRRLSPVARW
jgi:hypothetical protein